MGMRWGARAVVLGALLACAGAAAASETAAPATLGPDGGRYRGGIVDGLREGTGRIDWDNGAYYEGGFVHGLYAGQGHLRRASGDDYRGQFEAGLESGHGRLAAADGSVYEGDFRRGLANGSGHFEDGLGARYDGSFRDGRFEGSGRLSTAHGVFSGNFRAGELDGPGEADYVDGRRYRGSFAHGRYSGQGRYDSADGSEHYEGEFVDDEFTGTGTYTSKANGTHTGRFVNWRPEGQGRYTDPLGDVYEGSFHEGVLQGAARVHYHDGARYEGEVKAGLPEGQGSLTRANGDVYHGGFSEGQFEGAGTLTYAHARSDGRGRLEGLWHEGQLVAGDGQLAPGALLETVLYNQPSLLTRSLARLQGHRGAGRDLYLLAVAGDGTQEVFRREVEYVQKEFEERFGTAGHEVLLVNSRSTLEQLPMASVTSIRQAVKSIAARMDREQDILFLFLTSHGSHDHRIALGLDGLTLPGLGAEELGRILRDSGIRWKVVVVSACFGGGFIAPLRDGQTLIMTAARADRSSFGCTDDSDFTYFGRAYFEEALPQSDSFQDAFARARILIDRWETGDALATPPGDAVSQAPREDAHSLPQIEDPPAIDQVLHQWWDQAVTRRAPTAAATHD